MPGVLQRSKRNVPNSVEGDMRKAITTNTMSLGRWLYEANICIQNSLIRNHGYTQHEIENDNIICNEGITSS